MLRPYKIKETISPYINKLLKQLFHSFLFAILSRRAPLIFAVHKPFIYPIRISLRSFPVIGSKMSLNSCKLNRFFVFSDSFCHTASIATTSILCHMKLYASHSTKCSKVSGTSSVHAIQLDDI